MYAENAVIAKVRAVCGNSLKAEDYAQLAAKESVTEICGYLRQTERYSRNLSALSVGTVHRGQLEAALRKSVFDVFERLYRFDQSKSRRFFKYIVKQLEIEQVLSALQCASAGITIEYIAALPLFLTEHSKIDLAGLGMSKSYAEASAILRGTAYEKTVCPELAAAERTGKLNICDIERKLYTQYYLDMLKDIEKNCGRGEKKELKRLVLGVIDMKNVVTVYRYSRFFGAGSNNGSKEPKVALIPFKRRLSDEAIEALAEQSDIGKIAAELDKLGYGLHSGELPQTVELLTDRISLDHLRKLLRLSQNSMVVYFAFTELLGMELKNIKTIVEGVRYGLDGVAILDMLAI